MPVAEEQFASLEFDGFSWDGQLPTQWLRPSTEFIINSDEFTGQDFETLTTETKAYVRAIADLPAGLYSQLQQFLFDHYQQNVFLKVYNECEFAPRLATADEIWTIVSEPSVFIPSPTGRSSHKVGFYTLFNCSWDPEHGFAVEHDRKFAPRSVVDSDQCCY